MAGLFANAQKVTEAPKKGKPAAKVTVPTKGLELYAALLAVEKAVKAQKSVVEAGIKNTILARGVVEGIRLGKKPDSYEGEENGSTASLQLRCRVSTSALSDEEQELLAEYDIPTDENVSVEDCFRINPRYSDMSDPKNAEILAKVEEALSALNLPEDFIQKQDKVAKVIATEDSIAAVCKITHKKGKDKGKPDEATIAALLPIVTTPAIRAKLAADKNPFEIVDQHTKLNEAEETEEKVAA
jgi:hypothetical protein